MSFNPDFLHLNSETATNNTLIQYLQQQQPEVLTWIAQSASPEIKQIISQNVQGLVGGLPDEDFKVQITTDRNNLAHLLASAMMTGYFLGQVEKRRDLENTWVGSDSLPPNPPKYS
jgi:23S rRNA G2069 N7-methylase RlmK/C1962 C5-methylase RlmI